MPDPKPVPRLRELLDGAKPKHEHVHRARYDHGGGRMYSHSDPDNGDGRRDLMLDAYNEGVREFHFTIADELPALLAALDLAHRLCERILNGDGESYFGDVTDLQDALYLLGVSCE